MSFHKMFSALCLASVMVSGCGAEPAPSERDSVQQAARGDGWYSANYNRLLGGVIGPEEISGIYNLDGRWYLSTLNNQTYAPVTRITYGGQAVEPQDLATSQGVFVLSGDRETLVQNRASSLEFTVEGNLNGTLRVTPSSTSADGSFTRYTTEWLAEGTDPDAAGVTFCPHPVTNADGTAGNQAEYVIPIGGARWGANGARVNDANSITLGCTHDVIGGCVDWGYGPWGTRVEEGTNQSRSMVTVHQACTRMKHGDICGSGDAGTTGDDAMTTTIHVKDRVGVHPDTNQTYATMEAFWDENGASCFNLSKYRSSDPVHIAKIQIQLALCPKPACTSTHTRMFLSARPCTATNVSGDCIAN